MHAGVELAALGKALGSWFPATGLFLSGASAGMAAESVYKAWSENRPINQSDLASLVGGAAGIGGAAIVLMGASGPIMVGVGAAALGTSVAAGVYQIYAQTKGLTWDPMAGKTVEVPLTADQRAQIDVHLQQTLPLWNQTSALNDLGFVTGTKLQTVGSVFSGPVAPAVSTPTPITPPPDAPTRNRTDFITDTSANDHLVVIKDGGKVWDAYVQQKDSTTGFKDWNEYQAAAAASNPGIANLNSVPAGTVFMQPEKLADGSICHR